MKKKILVCMAAGLIAFGTIATASATPINFDFTPENLSVTGSNSYTSVNMTAGGVKVDITAHTIDSLDLSGNPGTTQITGQDLGVYVSTHNNLGVYSNTNTGYYRDTHGMDGGSSGNSSWDPDEGLLFTFDTMVSLNYINFDYFHWSDDFNLTVDGTTLLVDWDADKTSTSVINVPNQYDEYKFVNITGQKFLFWADANDDSFRIDRMEVSPVPEPATMFLLGIGLVGLAGLRRRQQRL